MKPIMNKDLENRIEIPSDLEANLENLLDGLNAASKIQSEKRPVVRFGRRAWALTAAASIVIVGWIGFNISRGAQPKDTFDDPRLAYAEVERVLSSISSNMKATSRGMEKADAIFEMQQDIFNGTYINNKKK